MAVEPRRLVECDEELAAARVRHARVGHREDALTVEAQIVEELILNRVARAAHARALRIAALNHEAVDDAVVEVRLKYCNAIYHFLISSMNIFDGLAVLNACCFLTAGCGKATARHHEHGEQQQEHLLHFTLYPPMFSIVDRQSARNWPSLRQAFSPGVRGDQTGMERPAPKKPSGGCQAG